MSSVIAAFISMLLSSPLSALNPQSVGDMWAKAEAQVAASSSPSPSPTPIASATSSTRTLPWRRQAVQSPTPNPSPMFAVSITPPPDEEGPGHHEPDGDGPPESPVAQAPSQASQTPGAVPSQSATTAPVSEPTVWTWPATPTPAPSAVQSAVAVSQPTPVPIALIGKYTQNAWGLPMSSLFTGRTPFHRTIASLLASGAKIRPHQVAVNWWSGGRIAEKPNESTPVYVGLSGQQTYSISCSGYGFACDASHAQMRLPEGAKVQSSASGNKDTHVSEIDTVTGQEIDLFACSISSSSAQCVDGGAFPFSGSGMAIDKASQGSTANAGGYALGLLLLSAPDIYTAISSGQPIQHGLGMTVSCTGNTPVWPSTHNADAPCQKYGLPADNEVVYGDVLAINTSFVVPSRASAPCKAILRTYQAYGAYVDDSSGGWGGTVQAENPVVYSSGPNPWYDDIERQMSAAGEGSSPGPGFGFNSCFDYTTSADWEVIELAKGS